MPLSGLEIYKHLPKTNCKDCGVPTCLAFAMKVAAGQAGLDQCPHVTPEAKAALGEASAPPQQLVKIGEGGKAIEIGQETVLFRHEERFHRPVAVAVRMKDDLDDAGIRERCQRVANTRFERMGNTLAANLVAVHNVSGDPNRFIEAAKVASAASGKALILMGGNANCLRTAAEVFKAERPLLWSFGGSSEEAIPVAKELSLPLVLEGSGFDDVVRLSEKARADGLKQLVLSPGPVRAGDGLHFLTQTRRAAIQKKFRPLGYPVAMVSFSEDPAQALVDACWYVLKYSGVIAVDFIEPHYLLSILTARQDIYTDPTIPVKVEPGLYGVGEPGPEAPVLVTTNFALSYYSVEPEVEAARVPANILSVDTEGTSVLTAWAADKFNAKSITKALKESGIEAKVKHRKLVLPGLVAVLKAGVEDESGWEAIIGPKEASGLVSFLKNQWKP